MSNEIMVIRMNGTVDIFEPDSFKLDDIKELGEGFLDVSDAPKPGLTIITNDEKNNGNWGDDERSKINSAALQVLSAMGVFKGIVVGYEGDLIVAGPFNDKDETISGIPDEWMNKLEEIIKG